MIRENVTKFRQKFIVLPNFFLTDTAMEDT